MSTLFGNGKENRDPLQSTTKNKFQNVKQVIGDDKQSVFKRSLDFVTLTSGQNSIHNRSTEYKFSFFFFFFRTNTIRFTIVVLQD